MELKFFIITLFLSFSQGYGFRGDKKNAENVLRTILKNKVVDINSENTVESRSQLLEAGGGSAAEEPESNAVSFRTGNPEDVPLPCLQYLATLETDNQCPDFTELIKQFRTVLDDIVTILVDSFNSFKNTFQNPEYQCTGTVNPLTAFRCFLRAFRAAYYSLKNLTNQIGQLKDNTTKFYKEYQDYMTGCNTSQTQLSYHQQKQMLHICNQISSK